jgi:tetratricopeptide (TPR) repeat protein
VLAAFSSSADAVRCAISVEQTARRPVAGARFDIRIGIHLGEVLRRDGGYFGTPVVTARRLCDRAGSGQILCSKLIAELLAARQTFSFRDLGQMDLKGLAAPTQVCEVLYERNDPAALLKRTPFVGRAAQLKLLSAKLGEACNGQGSIVMLCGEPGIGKTRTLEEFSDLAKQQGALTIRGACYDGEWQAPYGPFAEAIVDASRRLQAGEFSAALGRRAPILARIAPVLNELIENVQAPPPLDKDEERLRLFDAVAQFLIAISRRTPVVLILDDLHWADRGTVAMLSHVARFVSNNSILMIGAYRDAEVDRKHPLATTLATISRQRDFDKLMLHGLEESDLVDLLGMIGDQDAPAALVKALGGATDGNPLFIREVLLHLVEERKIWQGGQGWIAQLNVEKLGIPDSVRQIVGRRLLRLSAQANRLLSVASAFNGEFSFVIAASVAELDEDSALRAIDEALDAQVLRFGSNSESFDFTHAVIRHTVYSELNPVRRVRLHRRIAEQMERAWGERAAEHAAEVAYQFWRGAAASGTERGVDYAIAAANNAESAYASDEVVAFLRIALELLPANDTRRPRLLARLGLGLAWTLNEEDAVKVTREAGDLIAAAESPEAAAKHLAATAIAMYAAGLMRGAWEIASAGLRHTGDRRDIVWACLKDLDLLRESAEDPNSPGVPVDSAGERELRAVLRRIPLDQLSIYGLEPPFESRQEIIESEKSTPIALLFMAGETRRSLPIWSKEAAEAERQGRIFWAMICWAGVARCHTSLGDFTAAQAALDRATALSRSLGRFFASLGLLNLLAAELEMCIAKDAGWAELLNDPHVLSLIQQQSTESQWASAPFAAAQAYVLSQVNQPEIALQTYLSVLPALQRGTPESRRGANGIYISMACDAAATLWFINRTDSIEIVEQSIREKVVAPDFRYPMRDGRLSMGRLCALQGRYEEASQWFVQARELLDAEGWRPLRAITDYDEALMFLRRGAQGDDDRARPLLATASQQFRTLGMPGWLKRAEQSVASIPEERSKKS